MRYHQITSEERHTLAALRKQHVPCAEIARTLGRHRSTIYRELRRNRCRRDDGYRFERAKEQASARRKRSRRKSHVSAEDWQLIEDLIEADLSPEQVSGLLLHEGVLEVSHETIYKHVWRDKRHGGALYRHLRQHPKRRRKRYGTHEKRGRVAGKRHISDRPAAVQDRREIGHWEIDTVIGHRDQHCIVSLVERVSGCVLIGKLRERTVAALNQRLLQIIAGQPHLFKTITADNGTEFHGYRQIEERTGTRIYFATPYHSWERGTNENTNGLIRQYLPRKRHHFHTPIEVLQRHTQALSFDVGVAVPT